MSAHWGALPARPVPSPENSSSSSIGKEYIMKARNMEVEGPQLHQPSAKYYPPVNESHPAAAAFQLDSLALHNIRLIQHARRLRHLIHSTTAQLTDMKCGESSDTSLTFPAAPPIPPYNGRPLRYRPQMTQPLPFLPPQTELSEFTRGVWGAPPPPEIDHRTSRRLLRKSVAAITAHSGFDNCGESVLETLTDISHDYMQQLTRLLRRAVDNRHSGPSAATATASSSTAQPLLHSGFPDSVEQVFHEIGLGSMTELHDFYQSRVIRYHDNLLSACTKLMAEYERLTSPESASRIRDDANRAHRVKDEPLSDINFPSMDDSEDGGTDSEQVLQLDGLGLDISVAQESQEEDPKWQQAAKLEPGERNSTSTSTTAAQDPYGGDDTQSSVASVTSEVARTPLSSSDADHASSSATDLLSPQGSGKPAKKKKTK